MKNLYILIVFIACTLSATAQSYLSQEFGRSYGEVKQFLAAKAEVTTQSPNADLITATTEGFRIEYYFNEGVLYKSIVVKYYASSKEAKTAVEAFRTYYELLQTAQIDLEKGKTQERFAAMHGREIHEVSAFAAEKGSIQITQSKIDLDRCPGSEMKDIVQNEVLLAMISK